MEHRTALISGASIAGLATAHWLARTGWTVTVVERAPAFRDGGQNVDIRGVAHQVIEQMGLTDQVLARNTTEEGTAYLGHDGTVLGRIPAAREPDGPTAEKEILRGDLARLILDTLPPTIDIRYDEQIDSITDGPESSLVTFASGATIEFSIVVIAEGVRSHTRDSLFGSAVNRHELGMNMAYGTIPRIATDDRWWRWYTATRRRGITLRPDDVGTIRATLAYVDPARDLTELPIDAAKAKLASIFADAGWQATRVTAGFAASEDVYVDYLTQIMMVSWHCGRVVVTGDAAWCVTPLGGGGTSIALTGAYVLAAYLSTTDDGDLVSALEKYESWMRPFVTDAQKLPPGTPDMFYPRSAIGVGILRAVQRTLTTRPLRSIAARAAHVARTDRELPEMRQQRRDE